MLLKDLKELLKVLQANGVTEYVTSELTLKLDGIPITKSNKKMSTGSVQEEPVNTEDLLFYSAAAPAATIKD